MNTKILELIALVNDKYNHIQQLETLETLLKEKYPEEYVVAKTTHNSHYNYGYLGHREYQHPENHINTFIDAKWAAKGQLSCIDKPLITADNDWEIHWPNISRRVSSND